MRLGTDSKIDAIFKSIWIKIELLTHSIKVDIIVVDQMLFNHKGQYIEITFKVSVRVILQCIYFRGGHSSKVPENMIQEFEFKKQ